MKSPYQRISCDRYDQFEIYATFKKQLRVQYLGADAKPTTSEFKIKTLETKDKAEYLISDTGLRIRLDQIISVQEIAS
ncbi:MAG: hypothetical protein AB8G15_22400 [Saprospiraceae bacterium]